MRVRRRAHSSKRHPWLPVVLGTLLIAPASGCAPFWPVGGPAGDSRIKYRLVTKADFWKVRSNYWYGDFRHGAEIDSRIERSDSYLEDFSFGAVMYRETSYWNRVIGPFGLLGALATKKKITFLATLKDGRKFLATANQKVYQTILGATI